MDRPLMPYFAVSPSDPPFREARIQREQWMRLGRQRKIGEHRCGMQIGERQRGPIRKGPANVRVLGVATLASVRRDRPWARRFSGREKAFDRPFTCLKIQYRTEAWLSAVGLVFPLRFRLSCF
jgi:hypothetical protein